MSAESSGRNIDPLLIDKDGHSECLLGNEAIVRGALESGVAFASGYPGTPSSEVTDSFALISKRVNIHFEYSVNEKIALEMAFAASLAGARSICAMKHLGLMYAGDPLSTIPYVGVVAGMVIVSAGDPSCHTSPNEQDQRHLAPMLFLPMLDPSTPQEALEMTRYAFDLSEKSQMPVIMRITTRVCHTRSVVRYKSIKKPVVTGFKRNPKQFVPMPMNARRMRLEIKDRLKIARDMLVNSGFLRRLGEGDFTIVATGSPAATCADIIKENGYEDKLTLLITGLAYPLPNEQIVKVLKKSKRILIVEELSPYLEDAVRALCNQYNVEAEVLGKRTKHLPNEFEYDPSMIENAIYNCFGVGQPAKDDEEFPDVPIRPPTFCPGCPHRGSYYAARAAFSDEYLYFNDIGCYTLGYGPPLHTVDALLCMGAGFTLAAGVSRVTGERTVGFLGDSTFFHSGMPALLNAVKENANMVAVILDNEVTAMTGFQESPSVTIEKSGPIRDISIENIVRALGAKQVETVDPYDLPATISAFERARDSFGVSVIITKRSCPVFMSRETKTSYKQGTYKVDHDKCKTCGREADGFRCSSDKCISFESSIARAQSIKLSSHHETNKNAPCSTQCPLSLCIQGYISNIAAGEYEEAFKHIMQQCPLPETVCRVCHEPCESMCVRNDIDKPVGINNLKRFVINWANENSIEYNFCKDMLNNIKVAVIGAGPSGLAAAHSLILRGFDVTIFDSQKEPGGLLKYGIPEFRLPKSSLKRDIERILNAGVKFEGSKTLGKDLFIDDLLNDEFKAVFLGVGALKGINLSLERSREADTYPKILDALTYLENVENNRLSENNFKNIVVIGGGNSAVDAARTALRQGAEKVTIVYRRSRDEMPALKEEINAAEKEGVILKILYSPLKVHNGNKIGLSCLHNELGEPDSSGRRKPVSIPNSEEFMHCDHIIAAIGQSTVIDLFKLENENLSLNEYGLLEVDSKTCQTSHSSIFAGGDVVPGTRTVSGSIAHGLRAAWGIDCKLRGKDKANKYLPPKDTVSPEDVLKPDIKILEQSERRYPDELSVGLRVKDYNEVVQPFTEAEARGEAERCLVCGMCGNCNSCIDLFGCPAFYSEDDKTFIDPNLCMGCGVCADICPNNAIYKAE